MSRYAIALLCFVYVISPVDLMPELLLGPFGLADDLVVGLIGVRALLRGEGPGG